MITRSTIRLYNTMSREIEDFIPVEPGKVKIYACGPTVYDYTHIGHIRKYVFDDVLVRLLRYLAYEVTHVMNITDVGHLTSDADTGEDKLEKAAKKENKSAWDVAKFYENYFFKTMDAVLVIRPNIVCRATEHIKEQIELVKKLEEKGFTYRIDDGIYFDTLRFPDYAKLAGFDKDKQLAGARVEPIPGKKHPTDFALWKLTPKGVKRQMEWDSPWGKGFPGWHIECSAMSLKYLGEAFENGKLTGKQSRTINGEHSRTINGEHSRTINGEQSRTINGEQSRTIDIHTGGIDHIPIHHTNEIAQSESATGKPFVRYWIHHNFLLVEGKKMSKSLNNFYTIDDVKKRGFDPLALRYLFLQTHYRQESNFTWEAMSAAQKALQQIRSHVSVIKRQISRSERVMLSDDKLDKVNHFRKQFKDTIRLDLNTPQALSLLWTTLKSNIPAGDKYDLLMIQDEILGLGLKDVTENQLQSIPENIQILVDQREKLRQQQNWEEADKIRQKITDQGFEIEDTPSGAQIKKKPLC